jgi:hypothetical protein
MNFHVNSLMFNNYGSFGHQLDFDVCEIHQVLDGT